MKYRLHNETSIQVEFNGEWVQVACIAFTTWSYPEQDKNIRLRREVGNIGKEIVDALNERSIRLAFGG